MGNTLSTYFMFYEMQKNLYLISHASIIWILCPNHQTRLNITIADLFVLKNYLPGMNKFFKTLNKKCNDAASP